MANTCPACGGYADGRSKCADCLRAEPMTDTPETLRARARRALELEDALWEDWRDLTIQLLAALEAAEQERDRLRAARRIHELDNHHNAARCPYCTPTLEADARRRREALAAVETLRQEREWQPIETAPKDRTSVLVTAERGGEQFIGEALFDPEIRRGSWWWAQTNEGDYHSSSLEDAGFTVTHWMPLPDPPRVGGIEPEKTEREPHEA